MNQLFLALIIIVVCVISYIFIKKVAKVMLIVLIALIGTGAFFGINYFYGDNSSIVQNQSVNDSGIYEVYENDSSLDVNENINYSSENKISNDSLSETSLSNLSSDVPEDTSNLVENFCQCESDLNCGDFSSINEAQECFEYCLEETGKDFHQLDKDGDKFVCESYKYTE